MDDLYANGLVTAEIAKGAADAETLNGAGVDMLGFGSVAFIASAEAGEALTFTIKAQQDEVSTFAAAADLEGTAKTFTTTAGAKGICILNIHNPQERYVRPVLTVPNATAAKGVSVVAIRYNAKNRPQSNTGESHSAPAEGTA